jgi:hypothetical protein
MREDLERERERDSETHIKLVQTCISGRRRSVTTGAVLLLLFLMTGVTLPHGHHQSLGEKKCEGE